MVAVYLQLSALVTFQEVGFGFPSFRLKLPNGGRVPCPKDAIGCKDDICQGLGHGSCSGGTLPLNKFGEDLKKNGYMWTKHLCKADSDGDGLTNGEELGDPCCRWKAYGISSDYTAAFNPTHPGDANHKQQRYTRPDCRTTTPKVAAPPMGKFNPGEIQKNVSLLIDNYIIPEPGNKGGGTTYVNFAWNFPDHSEEGFHAILVEAIVNTPGVLHHFVAWGCDVKWPEGTQGKVATDSRDQSKCNLFFGAWSPGNTVLALPSWAGHPLGKKFRVQSLFLNVHFDNAARKKGIIARDGIRVFYTPTLRPEYLSVFAVMRATSIPTLVIPPKTHRYFITRECIVKITKQASGKLAEAQIFGAAFHAHTMASEMVAERIRGNERLPIVVQSPWHYRDHFVENVYVKNITLRTGDKIYSTCVFNSESRNTSTQISEGTSDEMCWFTAALRPGGLQATCQGNIWAGKLAEEEVLLGLSSRHPITAAQRVWKNKYIPNPKFHAPGSIVSAAGGHGL